MAFINELDYVWRLRRRTCVDPTLKKKYLIGSGFLKIKIGTDYSRGTKNVMFWSTKVGYFFEN